jgi:hypothetical protein
VHEVVADGEDRVAVAAAVGFGWSADHGTTWAWTTDGLRASYARAVALDGDAVLVSASTGPYTRQAGVYRAQLGHAFERCEQGLPEWFSTNVDTGCLALSGSRAVIGTRDGTVYTSDDRGATWQIGAKGLGSVDVVQLR